MSCLRPRETRAAWEVPIGGAVGGAGRLKVNGEDPKEFEPKVMTGGTSGGPVGPAEKVIGPGGAGGPKPGEETTLTEGDT